MKRGREKNSEWISKTVCIWFLSGVLNNLKLELAVSRNVFLWGYIPSEKIGQNIDPLRNSFFVANYQHWTSTSALEPFLGPLDPWGALGGPWVVWGGLTTPKLPFSFEDQFKPWN